VPNRTLGPWEKHQHTYNCDCGTYPESSGFRGVWYFRPNSEGDEIVYAFSEEDKSTADEKAVDDGWVIPV